jgi:hypothetical protein
MPSRRPVIATLATAVLGLGLLTGCEKPLPEVGALAGGEFAKTTATLWCFEGQAYTAAGKCRENKHTPTRLKVRPGAPVAVEVPADVKDRGWFVRIVDGKNQVAAGPIQKDKTYFTLAADFQQGNTMSIQVVALPQGPGEGETSGFWEFALVNADAS